MATDRDLCKACEDLKYNAPHFVANGLTDKECQSLMNNTGLDPKANHDDCEDLHNMQDCLMEGLKEDIPSYDDCDWKTAFTDLLTNLNNMLQAIVCVICGLWDEIARLWNKIQQICNALNTLLALIRGASPNAHYGQWTREFLNAVTLNVAPEWTELPKQYFKPNFMCDILAGATCDSNKDLGRYFLGWGYDQNLYPRFASWRINTPIEAGTVIGTIPMSAVTGVDMSESRFKDILRAGSVWYQGQIGGDTSLYFGLRGYVKVNGVTFNSDLAQYGQNVGVITIEYTGTSRTGGFNGNITRGIRTYDV